MSEEKETDRVRFKFGYPRLLVQITSLLVLNGLLFTRVYPYFGLDPLPIPLPVLVSVNSTTSMFVGAMDLLQLSLAQPEFPWIVLAVLFIVGAFFGRLFCGWVCPIGFIQDVITQLRGVLEHVSPRTHKQGIRLKYLLLAGTLLISGSLAATLYLGVGEEYKRALGVLGKGPLIQISPDATLFGTIPRLLQAARENWSDFFATPVTFDKVWNTFRALPTLVTIKLIVLCGFVYGAYRVPRFWCRYLCPMGATMSFFQKFSLLGIKRDPVKCSKCPHCEVACPMQIKILDLPWEKFNDPECILCMECVDSCPHSSLSPKFP